MITLPSGEKRKGQVLESSAGLAAVQVFGPTTGFDTLKTSVSFSGETLKLPVSDDMLGRGEKFLGEAAMSDNDKTDHIEASLWRS